MRLRGPDEGVDGPGGKVFRFRRRPRGDAAPVRTDRGTARGTDGAPEPGRGPAARPDEREPADRFLDRLPLFHTSAEVYSVLPSLACAGSLVPDGRFGASRLRDAVAASGATIFNDLGTMLAILAGTPPTPAERRRGVRAAIGGGATAELERACAGRFGVPLVKLYALTGTSTVTVRPLDAVGSPGSAGWPASCCDEAARADRESTRSERPAGSTSRPDDAHA